MSLRACDAHQRRRAWRRRALAGMLGVVLLLLLLSAGVGPYPLRFWDIPRILFEPGEARDVLIYLRLPRTVLAVVVGAALGGAGAALQGLFRNPLADPGLIGVSAGATLGAALWVVLGENAGGVWSLAGAAFCGGLAVTGLVSRLARREGDVSSAVLLLAGVAVNALVAAALGLLLYASDAMQWRAFSFWTLGGLTAAGWPQVGVSATLILVGGIGLLRLGTSLDALSLGEREAFCLGVPVRRVSRVAVGCSALVVGAAVAAAGTIGFIGLVAPHLLRLGLGAGHRTLLPGAMLLGAALLLAADLGARVLVAPEELPVGILTSLLGAPFFLWLLHRYHRRTGQDRGP